jgi:hypothetical protein
MSTMLELYLYTVLDANRKILGEVVEMGKRNEPTLEQVLDQLGFVAKWEAKGKAEGVTIGKKTGWERAGGLLKQGATLEQLERMGPSDSLK